MGIENNKVFRSEHYLGIARILIERKLIHEARCITYGQQNIFIYFF